MSTWEARRDEAIRLAPRADESVVAERLRELLQDPEDTAVSQAAGDALLDRADLVGVRLYVEAMGLADSDTIEHLADCLADGTGARARLLAELLPPLLDDLSAVVRASAAELLADLPDFLGH